MILIHNQFVQDLYIVQGLKRICTGFVQDLCRICTRFVQDLCRICIGFVKNLWKVCIGSFANALQIHYKSFKHFIFLYYSGLLINPSGSFANRPWYVKNKNGHEKVTEKSPRPLNTTVLLEISSRIWVFVQIPKGLNILKNWNSWFKMKYTKNCVEISLLKKLLLSNFQNKNSVLLRAEKILTKNL